MSDTAIKPGIDQNMSGMLLHWVSYFERASCVGFGLLLERTRCVSRLGDDEDESANGFHSY